MLILYHQLNCCWSRAIRIVLQEKFQAVELREFYPDSQDGSSVVPHLIVPDGIMTPDGRALESIQLGGGRLILEYLNEAFPQREMLGETPGTRAETRRLTEMFADPFWQAVGRPLYQEKVINSRARRRGLFHVPFDSREIKAANDALLSYCDFIGTLFEQRQWLAGHFFSIADAMVTGQISALDLASLIPWVEITSKVPAFRNWYALAKSRPAFGAVVMDRLEDVNPPVHYENPDF